MSIDTPSFVAPASDIRVGDVFTISGVEAVERNPDRRWWQLWKPRFVATGRLQSFRVIGRY